MKKSIWIEAVEWIVLVAMMLLTVGVVVMRSQITATPEESSSAPVVTFSD